MLAGADLAVPRCFLSRFALFRATEMHSNDDCTDVKCSSLFLDSHSSVRQQQQQGIMGNASGQRRVQKEALPVTNPTGGWTSLDEQVVTTV